jgi:hypothetical protein
LILKSLNEKARDVYGFWICTRYSAKGTLKVRGIINGRFVKYNLRWERRIIMSKEQLPRTFTSIVERYPEVWEAHEQLTKACSDAVLLTVKLSRL